MFRLPDLPYDYRALEPFIDSETMRVHHDGHHATYVKNLNEALTGQEKFLGMNVEKLLGSLDQVPEGVRAKVKNNAGGHYHHSIFWQTMKKDGSQPQGRLLELLNQTFGDIGTFKEQFNNSALSVFGSGWTWLVKNGDRLEIANTPNQDSPLTRGKFPILGIDLWEHAYYLKYKNRRADYISAWWNVVHWAEAETRFAH